jgi:hypothetical protein
MYRGKFWNRAPYCSLDNPGNLYPIEYSLTLSLSGGNKQATLAQAGAQPKLNNKQWQALIALHRTLLHEHHDFFLASQHPSASPTLRRLASKYKIPARMWQHGIHSKC